jgi:hypothetical protein
MIADELSEILEKYTNLNDILNPDYGLAEKLKASEVNLELEIQCNYLIYNSYNGIDRENIRYMKDNSDEEYDKKGYMFSFIESEIRMNGFCGNVAILMQEYYKSLLDYYRNFREDIRDLFHNKMRHELYKSEGFIFELFKIIDGRQWRF